MKGIMMDNATLGHPGHVSVWGRRLGERRVAQYWWVPGVLATFWAVGAIAFAPSDVRVAWTAPGICAGLVWFLLFPVWYFRGWARWACLGGLLVLAGVGGAVAVGSVPAVLAIFG